MSKYCPIIKRKVVYLDCLECEDRQCDRKKQEKETSNEERTDRSPDKSGK